MHTRKEKETSITTFESLSPEMKLLIISFLDINTQMRMAMTSHYWQDFFNSEVPEYVGKKEFVNRIHTMFEVPAYREEVNEKSLFALVANALNTTAKDILSSSKLEEMVFNHILALQPNISQRSLSNMNVSRRASCFYSMLNKKLCITYHELSVEQVRDIATAYNRFYPGINACYYLGRLRRDEYKYFSIDNTQPGAVLGLDGEVFCRKVLPVVKGAFYRPSQQYEVEEAKESTFNQPKYRC